MAALGSLEDRSRRSGSSHAAMMERNHALLFRASLEWLERGTIDGTSNGMVKMGY